MEQQKTNTGAQWLIFLASAAALGIAIYMQWEYLTLILPFMCTSFVKALRLL